VAEREPTTVLVIEDDRPLIVGLDLNLRAEGYRCLVAEDGETGLELALAEAPDLIVLDLGLPGMSGFEVLRRLRARGRNTPVVILSARAEVQDKVDGLGLGADDYVTKPFSLRELLARVEARLRRARTAERAPRRLRFGDVEADLDERRVWRGGEEVTLSAREFDLLVYLGERARRVHSRQSLLEAVWSWDYEGTPRTVDNFVRTLRVKLEEDPSQPRHLLTVRGAGYRFEP